MIREGKTNRAMIIIISKMHCICDSLEVLMKLVAEGAWRDLAGGDLKIYKYLVWSLLA